MAVTDTFIFFRITSVSGYNSILYKKIVSINFFTLFSDQERLLESLEI